MTSPHRLIVLWLLAFCAIAPARAHAQAESAPDVQLVEARRLFDELEYEKALSLLDQIVSRLDGATDDAGRSALATALDMRARAHFGLGNQQLASDDFARLVSLDPAFTLPPNVNAKIVALFEEIRKTRVGIVSLLVEPLDAVVQIDGRPAQGLGPFTLAVGEHQITATRPGYRPFEERFPVTGGSAQNVTVALVRVSAAVTIVASPPGAEILLNGASRGTIQAGPLPPDLADLPGRMGVPAAEIGVPVVLDDLLPGTYTLQFRRPCYQNQVNSLVIDTPRDIRLDPIVLKPAVSSLRVESTDPEATVYIDDQSRGPAPLEIKALCEGEHRVELRSPGGRYYERVTAVRGGSLRVSGVVKPAFAIVSVTGLPQGYRGQDLRLDLERALRSAAHVTFFAPPIDILKPNMASEQLTDDSLSFDLDGRPQGAASRMSTQVRRTVVRKLSQALDVQGIAAITVIGGELNVQRMAVSVFAAGGSQPDVYLVDLQDTSTLSQTIEKLDYSPAFSAASLGFLAIDVSDVDGVVVARVDANGPAAAVGLKPGERLLQVAAQPIKAEADLLRVLEQRRTESLPSVVADREGTRREVVLRPVTAIRLVSVFDQTLPFNALTAYWRSRARQSNAADEAALVRLNLAVAAYRIGDYEAARDELERTQLPEGSGISQGTVQYLLGLAYEGLTDISRARQAYTRASASEGATLTDQGGRIADLAKQKLATLR